MARSYEYVIKTLYDSSGYTGNTYYYKFVRLADGKIWDNVNNELATNPNWEDAAINAAEVGNTGQYTIKAPIALTDGNYDVVVYKQAGSAPANTDDVETQFDVSIGSIFGF